MSAITSGELIAAMLKAEGVDTVFGIIDGTYFGFYSSLRRVGIRLVTPRHESSAVHAAGAYSRATGKLGVAMASNGPGVANALPGVAVEQGEGHRVLLITSARRTGISYPERGGTFQYFDQVKTISGMAKQSQAVPSAERVPEMMRRAFRASFAGRPGVVHIDVPENIMNGESPYDVSEVRAPHTYRRTTATAADPTQVQQVAAMLRAARTPLIHSGFGAIHAGAFAELRAVAEFLGAPVVTSWAGRGILPETHPLAVAMPFIEANNTLRNNADLILVLGSRIGETDWWGKAPYWARPSQTKTVQVDIDDATLGGTRAVDVAVLADIKVFLTDLLAELQRGGPVVKQPNTWQEMIYKATVALDKKAHKEVKHGLNPGRVPAIAQQVAPEDTLWVFDGGNTAVWSHFYHQTTDVNTVFTTFKFGMLGAGVGQALGVQVAHPDRRVVTLIGDGAMGMHPQELETAVRNNLPVIYVVFVDKQWGMVKMNQQFALKPVKTVAKKLILDEALKPEETINGDLGEIRWDEMARAMGAHGEYVTTEAQFEAALKESLDCGKPAIIHVEVDPVAHMWAPALKNFKDMHAEPKG